MDDLDFGDILAIHVNVVEGNGRWAAPLRDEEALRVVLTKVETARQNDSDPIQQGAILAVGLIQAHPFIEANVQTAYAALRTHLNIYGLTVKGGSTRSTAQYLRVIAEEHGQAVAVQLFDTRLRSMVIAIDATGS